MKKQILIIVFSFIFLGFIGVKLQKDRWVAPKEAKAIKNPVKGSLRGVSANMSARYPIRIQIIILTS